MHIVWELPRGIPSRLLGVAGVVLCIAIGYWWSSAPVQSTPISAPRVQSVAKASEYVMVDVVGSVRSPGVVRLPADARVLDAVEAAGGVLRGHPPVINLARHVIDGEQIVVGGAPVSSSGTAATGGGGRIDINSASIAQLDGLPGIGAVLAQRIIDYRQQHGRFTAIRDLLDVPGIGDAKYADLAEAITVA